MLALVIVGIIVGFIVNSLSTSVDLIRDTEIQGKADKILSIVTNKLQDDLDLNLNLNSADTSLINEANLNIDTSIGEKLRSGQYFVFDNSLKYLVSYTTQELGVDTCTVNYSGNVDISKIVQDGGEFTSNICYQIFLRNISDFQAYNQKQLYCYDIYVFADLSKGKSYANRNSGILQKRLTLNNDTNVTQQVNNIIGSNIEASVANKCR